MFIAVGRPGRMHQVLRVILLKVQAVAKTHSVEFGDENVNEQVVENSQNADIEIDGNENEVEFEQSLEQSGFSPEVSTECTQSVAQAASGFFHLF